MKLRNKSRRMQVFNLPHDVVCGTSCGCTKTERVQTDHNPATGDVGLRHSDVLIARSVHIAPGSTSGDLPEAAANVPEISAAIKSRAVEAC